MSRMICVLGMMVLLVLTSATSGWCGKGSGGGSTSTVTQGSSTTSVDEDSDRPDYAGTQGNENKPGSGNTEPGVSMGELYGDLYVIVRDENGAPILYQWVWENGVPVSYYVSATGYVQPIAITGSLPQFNDLVPLDIEGEIPDAYAAYAQVVEFGRLNAARAPQTFLDRAYTEAINAINAADAVSTDPAGRLLLINDGEEKAIDAPRENLALYQKLMKNGYLTGLTRTDLGALAHLLPIDPTVAERPDVNDLQLAAALVAAASDKTASIGIDLVVYLNSILGINGTSATDYFNFTGFAYQRQHRHGTTRAQVLQGPYPYPQGGICFTVGWVNIMDKVFGHQDANGYNARGFAKAGDDALKVIAYIHNWALPEYDE